MRSARNIAGALLVLSIAHRAARAAELGGAPPHTIETATEAGEAVDEPARKGITWNQFDWPASTFRFGGGFLVDYATFVQDDESKQQIAMDEDVGLRDLRLVLSGRFKTKRPLSWTIGYMYDAKDDSWRFRQTGIEIGFPEARGKLFVGRTKEGYSLVKVMTGYYPWGMERTPALDFVPILADGVKWMGYFPKPGMFFSLGFFADELSERESFATYDHQIVTRVGWTPVLSEERGEVLHVAVMARDGRPDENSIQIRAKPESNLAPFFVDTGRFAADHARTTGVETYYRSGSWLFGGEYSWQGVDAASGENPGFHGGNVVATWLITGETRSYNAAAGIFGAVSPARTVFEGGKGAWEAVLVFSSLDLDSGNFRGGKMWRVTPMVNWYLSDNYRLEFGYGYGVLDRFGLQGHTQFFQSRLQITL